MTDDKIKPIHSGVKIPDKNDNGEDKPNEHLVEALKSVLKRAEEGFIQDIVLSATGNGDKVLKLSMGTPVNPWLMYSMLQVQLEDYYEAYIYPVLGINEYNNED